jgi:hypothetical protein
MLLPEQDGSIIPLRDQIILGPIDRYKKYHKFPWKFLLHIFLLFITSIQIYTFLGQEIHDSQATIELFYQLF